jgi:hypothetical protein
LDNWLLTMETLFLESTINADRHFSKMEKQNKIRENLTGRKLVTSHYVIGELKNNFLKNSTVFYNILVEEDTVQEALKRFGENFFSVRQFDRVLKVFSYIADRVGFEKEDVLERLEIMIEESMVDMFKEDIDEFVDECKCVRAEAVPKKVGQRYILEIGCKQNPKPNCQIENIFEKYSTELTQISALDEFKDSTMGVLMGKMLNDEKKKYGTNCWKIADAIIALEVPNDQKIYTTNLRDYQPICSLIQKDVFCPN